MIGWCENFLFLKSFFGAFPNPDGSSMPEIAYESPKEPGNGSLEDPPDRIPSLSRDTTSIAAEIICNRKEILMCRRHNLVVNGMFFLFALLLGGAASADPLARIEVNDAVGELALSTTDPFSIVIDLDAGDWAGSAADWWSVAYMPGGTWAYYVYPDGWRDGGTALDGIAPAYQGSAFNLPGFEVLNASALLEGSYHLYFGVDGNMNGSLEAPVFYDHISLSVAAGASSTVDVAGTWIGTWSSSAYSLGGTFSADIVQWGALLNGSISVPQIGMSGAALVGSVQGSTFVFGDIDNRITFTGTLSDASTASGSYAYPAVIDSGTWQGGKGAGNSSCTDLTSLWSVTETGITTTCEIGNDILHMSYAIVQDGCGLVASDDAGGTFTGTGTGNSYSVSGSRPDEVGVTQVTSAQLTVSADGSSLSGSAFWTWSDGSYSCSGTSSLSGERT
jgi:hypothetical protein